MPKVDRRVDTSLKPPRWSGGVVWLGLAIGAAAVPISIVFALVRFTPLGIAYQPKTARFDDAIRMLQNGELTPGAGGVIRLPMDMQGLTVKGCAHSCTTSAGVPVVVFPTWCGKGGNFGGFAHAVGGLPLSWVSVNPPVPAALAPADNFEIVERLPGNWYRVRQSMD